MTLIRNLIEIPGRDHGGDFVLKLSEGVARCRRQPARLRGYAAIGDLLRARDGAGARAQSRIGRAR